MSRSREVVGRLRSILAPGAGRTLRRAPESGRDGAILRASAEAFGRVLLLLEADGAAVLAAGEATLAVCAEVLGTAEGDAEAVMAALKRLDAAGASALRALATTGAPCDFTVRGPRGRISVSGRVVGALALVELSIDRAQADRSAGGEASPGEAREGASARGQAAALARQPGAQSPIVYAVADAVIDAVAIFDADRRLTYHNDAFARLWGLEPAWLADGPAHGALLDRLRQSRRLPETADYERFKSEELARHQRLDAAPAAIWRVAGGRTLRVRGLPHPEGGLVLIFADITSEMRLKSQFNHLVQVQRATLDKLTDAVAVFGADGRLKLYNGAFQALWAIPVHALTGAPPFDDIVDRCVHRLHDMAFWKELKGRITDLDPGLRAAVRGEALTADGRCLAWQSRPLPDGATLVSFVDITDTRQLEMALRDREAALNVAETLKKDFISSVSHELRTPLTTILGYAELLDTADRALSERSRGWVTAVRTAASALARSVEDILTFAEIDAGEMSLERSDADVAGLLEAAVARWAAPASAGEIDLRLDLESDPGTILANPDSLGRVLDHLIEHAISQTLAGGRVRVSARRAFGEVCLEVADTGRGIPFHIQARIWDRFSGEEGAGTGLGLALVKALVELHGGWVEVESVPGAGATFACHLPVAGQSDVEADRGLA